jgi:Fe-Mn family superoxide dismutase
MKHELVKLSYSYDALEPYIDAQTMEIHHSKHHQNYVNNLNAALEKHPELFEPSLESLLSGNAKIPEDIFTAVKNNAGGVYNHNFFWSVIGPGQSLIESSLSAAINIKFSSLDKFKEEFTKAALSRFGSGWAWLVLDSNKELEIYSTGNQDSPISEGKTSLLTIDVWEHAYYLKYQNRRADYISNWWNVVNWNNVSDNYSRSI